MFAALIGAPCDVELEFTNEEDLLRVPMKKEGSTETDVRVPPFAFSRLIGTPSPVRGAAAAAPQSSVAPPAGSPQCILPFYSPRGALRGRCTQDLYLFTDKEDVSGVITIKPNGKPVAHEGIKIECIGQIGATRCPLQPRRSPPPRAPHVLRSLPCRRKGRAPGRKSSFSPLSCGQRWWQMLTCCSCDPLSLSRSVA